MKTSFQCPCCENKIDVHISSASHETGDGLKVTLYVTGVSMDHHEATSDALKVLKNAQVRNQATISMGRIKKPA